MKTLAITTALVMSLAVPAMANDQLARTLGVNPGDYSTAELIRLNQAMQDNDRATVAFILSGGAGPVSSDAGIAAAITHAEQNNDPAAVRALESSTGGVVATSGDFDPVALEFQIQVAEQDGNAAQANFLRSQR